MKYNEMDKLRNDHHSANAFSFYKMDLVWDKLHKHYKQTGQLQPPVMLNLMLSLPQQVPFDISNLMIMRGGFQKWMFSKMNTNVHKWEYI